MNNFTFVAHKGARPEKSELVKSHVMRESQRRRREAKGRRGRSGALKYISFVLILTWTRASV
jgi:hypothetical protein